MARTVDSSKRSERFMAIRKIINEQPITTQEQLINALFAMGFDVTQATVSRDIKELGLVKTIGSNGMSHYVFPENLALSASRRRYYTIIRESVLTVQTAGNLVVVKCHSGMGNAACESLDAVLTEHVVGTIAGDNTIFIAVDNPQAAEFIMEEIQRITSRQVIE